VTLFLSSNEGFMGLRKEHSILQLFLVNEGFFIESRYGVGNPFNEGLFKPDQMGEALILLMSSRCEM